MTDSDKKTVLPQKTRGKKKVFYQFGEEWLTCVQIARRYRISTDCLYKLRRRVDGDLTLANLERAAERYGNGGREYLSQRPGGPRYCGTDVAELSGCKLANAHKRLNRWAEDPALDEKWLLRPPERKGRPKNPPHRATRRNGKGLWNGVELNLGPRTDITKLRPLGTFERGASQAVKS